MAMHINECEPRKCLQLVASRHMMTILYLNLVFYNFHNTSSDFVYYITLGVMQPVILFGSFARILIASLLCGPKVVLQTLEPGRTHRVMGMPFPVGGQWAYWAELVTTLAVFCTRCASVGRPFKARCILTVTPVVLQVLIQVLVPGTSLLGHLSGILAGLLYTADALDGVFATVRQLTGRCVTSRLPSTKENMGDELC